MPKFEIIFAFESTDLSANDTNTFDTWDVILLRHADRECPRDEVYHVRSCVIDDGMELHLVHEGETSNASIFCDAIKDDDQTHLEQIERVLFRAGCDHFPDRSWSELFSFEIDVINAMKETK